MVKKRTVEVCLSPALTHLYDLSNKLVVVTDVLRATSAMCVALEAGADHIIPVNSVEESLALKAEGYIAAAERNGKVVEGFEFGNSPLSYLKINLKGKKLAITTTNGTKAISMAAHAPDLITGAFLNLKAVADYVKKSPLDVVIICAGWKDNVNLEDSLFAGALIESIAGSCKSTCDAGLMTQALYQEAKSDLKDVIRRSSHFVRLSKLGIEEDINYCLQLNKINTVPVLKDGKLVAHSRI